MEYRLQAESLECVAFRLKAVLHATPHSFLAVRYFVAPFDTGGSLCSSLLPNHHVLLSLVKGDALAGMQSGDGHAQRD